MGKDTPTVLVAMLPYVSDWILLKEQLWYRIPTKTAPPIIRTGEAEYIAFYHTADFQDDLKWKVVCYAKIKRMVTVSRKQLFPEESPYHPKAGKTYYKIEFEKLEFLNEPIISRRGHRGTFVPTTHEKFFSGTTDFNRLFRGSFLEQDMERIIDAMEVEYEREFQVNIGKKKHYNLDFAIFCKKGCIDIECDGDKYHMGNENVHYDKTRNNELTSHKWAVLRYTTKHFNEERQHMYYTIEKTIREFGGALKASEPDAVYLPKTNFKGQISLF